MTNCEVLSATCTLLCSAFYPDNKVLNLALFNEGLKADKEAGPKDKKLVAIAINLVLGFVESGRSEGGISVSVNEKSIRQNIIRMCKEIGIDASQFVNVTTIYDGSNRW